MIILSAYPAKDRLNEKKHYPTSISVSLIWLHMS